MSTSSSVNRRRFLQATGGASAGLAAGVPLLAEAQAASGAPAPAAAVEAAPVTAGGRSVTLRINGAAHALRIEPRVTLLDALREVLFLTGTKKGCDRGQCGACTVLVDGRRINSCLTLAVMVEGSEITTIEGLGQPEALHPMQAAFVAKDAFQCGYCTPGQICSAVALVAEWQTGQASAVTFGNASPANAPADALAGAGRRSIPISDAEIAERMSGNLCRCGAYPNIVAAVRSVVETAMPGASA